MSRTCAVVPAAGRGLRMGEDRPKQFLQLSGQSILIHTLDALARAGFISHIFAVVPKDFVSETEELIHNHFYNVSEGQSSSRLERLANCGSSAIDLVSAKTDPALRITVVVGGVERQDSVFNALKRLPPDCDWVVIHDGVRPFVSQGLLKGTWEDALKKGASIAAVPATDTVKLVLGGHVMETLTREQIWLVQTPQVFRKDIILKAYHEALKHGWQCTDDASFVERLGVPVSVVAGERTNIKVTTPEDLVWASWFLTHRRSSEIES